MKRIATLHFGKITLHFQKLQGETGSMWTVSSAKECCLCALISWSVRTADIPAG